MGEKPTYEQLRKRVQELEQALAWEKGTGSRKYRRKTMIQINETSYATIQKENI